MRSLFPENRPALVLAPMQDVTDLPFMRVMSEFGGPDYFVTEYFRVHQDSRPEKHILRSITQNETGKPIFAQLIGMDIPAMVKNVEILQRYEIEGIDINMGCPAPVVCRKDAGGGLLRKLDHVNDMLGTLRDAVHKKFTVKTRVGYESHEEFEIILQLFRKHDIDALAIHGRTVKERYQTPVHDDCIKHAVETMACPVIANGNVVNVATGRAYHAKTNAAGLMIGRGAIRSPWIFQQLKDSYEGKDYHKPTRKDLRHYVEVLYHELAKEWKEFDEQRHVNKMKRYLIYISQGIDADFEFEIRRVKSAEAFFGVCDKYLLRDELLPELPPENSKIFCGFSALLED
ncbi:tRNA-dihydrouridine synthase family protein [Rubritalea halochordaticola]